MNNFRRMLQLRYENYSLSNILFLDIQTKFKLEKPRCKNAWWKDIKNENCKSYLGNKDKK